MTVRRGTGLGCLLAAALALAASPARANGYEGAKALIVEAERAFGAQDDATALRLLKQALTAQTTLDRKREEYGYAAYVHYRLGKYYWEHGNRDLASKEIKRALGVTASQQFVDEGYLVSRADPLVREVLPFVAKHKVVPLKDGRLIPNAIALLPRGRRVFVMGDHSVAELDRGARTLTVLHEQPGDSLYRLDAKPDGSALVIAYERGDHLVYQPTDGSPPVRLRRPFLPEDLFFDPRGDNAILWDRRRAVKLPLAGGQPHSPLFALKTPPTRLVLRGGVGNMVLRTAEAGVSAGFFPDRESRDGTDGTIRYVAHFFSDGQAVPLVERRLGYGAREEVMRVYAEDDRAFGLFFRNRETNSNRLLTIDLGTRVLTTSDVELGVEPWEQSRSGGGHAGTIIFSAKHDYVVALSCQGTRLRVLRYVPGSNRPSFDQAYDLSATLAPGGPELVIHGASVLADNARLWIATSTAVVLMDFDGEARAASLATLLGTKNYEWDARPYGFSAPDELYLPLAKGKGRYLVRVGMDEIERKARKLSTVSGDRPAKALPISHRDCSTLRAGVEQAFDGSAAQMVDVRRAVAAWKTRCEKEKPWLAFGLAVHILSMPAALESSADAYQRELFAAVRDTDAPTYGLFERAVTSMVDASRQQALALLNVARFAAWLGDVSQAPSFACTSGMWFTQLLAMLREDQPEWQVFWQAEKTTAAGCLNAPKGNRLRTAWCETAAETKGFDRARLGKSMQRDLERECRR